MVPEGGAAVNPAEKENVPAEYRRPASCCGPIETTRDPVQ
jgi:hypothetical protein